MLPWPPPELIQKIYQSRQVRAFTDDHLTAATSGTGFYSDLQSIHSEDTITWSVFGPVIYTSPERREAFVRDLLSLVRIDGSSAHANVWLWRRLPHPDTLVSGGPEIDFGIHTDDVFVPARPNGDPLSAPPKASTATKTRSLWSGILRKIRVSSAADIGRFAVLGVSWNGGIVDQMDAEADGVALHARDTTWDAITRITSHPCAEEVRAYLQWRSRHSKP